MAYELLGQLGFAAVRIIPCLPFVAVQSDHIVHEQLAEVFVIWDRPNCFDLI